MNIPLELKDFEDLPYDLPEGYNFVSAEKVKRTKHSASYMEVAVVGPDGKFYLVEWMQDYNEGCSDVEVYEAIRKEVISYEYWKKKD